MSLQGGPGEKAQQIKYLPWKCEDCEHPKTDRQTDAQAHARAHTHTCMHTIPTVEDLPKGPPHPKAMAECRLQREGLWVAVVKRKLLTILVLSV